MKMKWTSGLLLAMVMFACGASWAGPTADGLYATDGTVMQATFVNTGQSEVVLPGAIDSAAPIIFGTNYYLQTTSYSPGGALTPRGWQPYVVTIPSKVPI